MDRKQISDEERLNSGHTQVRGLLRVIGPVLLGTGLLFMAIGLIDFFAAFGSFEPPKRFWCMFVGMPLVGLGSFLSKIAYFGLLARYMSAEAAPVAKDSFNYMASETRDGVRDIASAIREGIVGDAGSARACPGCQKLNDADAKFCDACGKQIVF